MIQSFCCVIPVYSHSPAQPVQDVIRRTLAVTPQVLVVDDVPGDVSFDEFYAAAGVEVIRHTTRTGVGGIFKTALAHLSKRGIAYMITMDPTGQCFPEDLPRFIAYLHKKQPFTITVGCRDFKISTQGKTPEQRLRKLANLMFRLETGLKTNDSLSNYCVYPVHFIKRLKIASDAANFQTELLTRAAWANAEIRSLRVRFLYKKEAPQQWTNLMVHLKLLGLRLLPCKKQTLHAREKMHFSLFRPKQFFSYLLRENATPGELAAAAFTGTYCAVLPLFGLHTPVVLYFATVFRLNKFLAFMIQHPFVLLPITPFLCIELGYLMRNGSWLTDISLQTVCCELHLRIWEWLLGSLVLAPVFAVLSALITYFSAAHLQKRIRLNFWAKQRKILTENKTELK